LTVFISQCDDQSIKDKIGQAIWDFYIYQIFELRKVHADPHPGNFIIGDDQQLGVIDFGCVKEIEPAFHEAYFKLLDQSTISDEVVFSKSLYALDFLLKEDDAKTVGLLRSNFAEMLSLLGKPFNSVRFDFSDDAYFKKIYELGESFSSNPELKHINGARGPQDALYINRTCFGLYSILNLLKARINTEGVKPYMMGQGFSMA
jgi:predicted unusual protein kinase regulating ubiquinone biosynthesis (AarF/ABC1/UbiB family)